ncbi:cyclin-T2 [Nilaparvata lugens]|uniref:cyclin-T2 n=1 Tax=Nilaparvata lugens TaxID=108931 RepID=UPI00193E198C|nr:cyclin-T2 [Nilaparvata lugens]XP_039290318.1 cyclin-T2 [Nilaparvata lugens]
MSRPSPEDRWYFTKEQLNNTPSIRLGYSPDKELSSRQQAANFIQDMGQRLQVTQLCINTAIVYMHRFYMFHSFTHFHRSSVSAAALFLAAKVEEQPRKLEYVIKVAHMCLHRDQHQHLDTKSEQYLELAQDLVVNENVLLQTLGFDVAIDHPHTHVVQCCRLVKASKDLAQTSYFMASNSLHLTTMCLQYKPTLVACFCIHLAVRWSNWEIPESNEGRPWFYYVDSSVTQEALERLTGEFLLIFDKCPSRLKRKIRAMSNQNQNPIPQHSYGAPSSQEIEKKHTTKLDAQAQQPSTSGFSQQMQRSMHGSSQGTSAPDATDKNAAAMQHSAMMRHYKKPPGGGSSVPHAHAHHSSRGSSHHPPTGGAGAPPKKSNTFPPPIRIGDYPAATTSATTTSSSRPGKPESATHYKQPGSHPHSSSSNHHHGHHNRHHNPTSSSSSSHHHHHSSSYSSHHSQYPPPPHSSSAPPTTTVGSSTYNKQKQPFEVPPRHSSNSSVELASSYNATTPIKQELLAAFEQNHKYDTVDTTLIKQEPPPPPHYNNRYDSSSHAPVVKQEPRFDNNCSYNSSMPANVVVKQEPNIRPGAIEHQSKVDFSTLGQLVKQENNDHNHRMLNASGSDGHDARTLPPPTTFKQTSQFAPNDQRSIFDSNSNNHHHHQNDIDFKPNPNLLAPVASSQHRKETPSDSVNVFGVNKASHKPYSQQPTTTASTTVPNSSSSSSSTNSNHKTVKAPSIFSPTPKQPSPTPIPVTTITATANVQSSIFSPPKQTPVVSNSGKFKRKRTDSSNNDLDDSVLQAPKRQQESVAEPIVRIEDIFRLDSGHVKEEKNNISRNSAEVLNVSHDKAVVTTAPVTVIPSTTVTTASSLDAVDVGATIEITQVLHKKHKEGREHKKKKKHKEHKEHKDRDKSHKHKEKHKSKDKNRDREAASSSNAIAPVAATPVDAGGGGDSGLKIKIPKEKVKLVQALPGFKFRISKEVLQGAHPPSNNGSAGVGDPAH